MKKVYVFLLFWVLFVAKVFAQSEPFYFIQLSDPQFGMLEKNQGFGKETKIMEQAVEAINKLDPAFIVVTGDMVNDGKDQRQIDEFKRICGLVKKSIPVYLVPGNHDLGQKATDESIQAYRKEYGCDCFSFEVNNTCFIGLNMSVIFANREEEERTQRIWMEKVLENSQKCNHRILFGHYPFFVREPDEVDKYENIPLEKRKTYLDLMTKYHVKDMFAGHLHFNAGGVYNDFKITVTNSICTPLGVDKIGLRILKIYPDKVVGDYYDLDKMPSEVTL